ncbi:EpsG family protein [uncultured Fusobacterium sp.]|uniref:EpsG family protein n=1 Tax=uncultured Fusobacterium sp. TaxID=159267 RepID=UPI0025FEA358|nr:EpsG family protein [uncultured Fusobacterium sp.]
MIYFSILVLIFFYSLKFEMIKTKKKFYLFSLGIVFILAFNYQMGSDWINYQRMYDVDIISYDFNDIFFDNPFQKEKGYVLLNLLGRKLKLNYEIFMGLLLYFCIILILKVGKRYSRNIYIFLYIILSKYILIASLEPTIRQFLAVTIITLGYRYIEKRKIVNYLFIIILATQFHKSAIIGIIVYFLDKINITLKKCIFLIAFFPIFLIGLPTIVEIIANFIPSIGEFSYYFTSLRYGINISRSLLGNIYNFSLMILYLYFIFFSDAKKQKNYIKNMAIIYILIGYFQNQLPILYRVQEYFVVGFAISMSFIGSTTIFNYKIKYNKKGIGVIFIVLVYLIMTSEIVNNIYGNELNKKRYGEYKNYFIELLLGRTKETFQEKSHKYEKEIKSMVDEQNRNKS